MSRKTVIIIHIIFWASYILLGVLVNVAVHHELKVTTELYWMDLSDPLTWVGYARTVLICYLSLWVFSYLFNLKQYLLSLFAIVLLALFDVGVRYVIEQLFIGPLFGLWQYQQGITANAYLINNIFYSTLGIFICFFLKIINDYFINEEIEKEKTYMELQFLKSQVNPHFLFNAFNNLYGLSLTEPHKTPDAILKLAELTRYMIYESNEEKVPLAKEIAYLKNLIELQKLRYDEGIRIDFEVKFVDNGQLIAPLLLIAFVENAFKHGDFNDELHPVEIVLSVQTDHLYFYVFNKISHAPNKDQTGGIGLINVRRRLELLYPGKFTINIQNDGKFYTCELDLILI
jgi:sensor histidine kinase YesM